MIPWSDARSLAEAAFEAMAPTGAARDYRVSVVCLAANTGDLPGADVHIINHRERNSPNG